MEGRVLLPPAIRVGLNSSRARGVTVSTRCPSKTISVLQLKRVLLGMEALHWCHPQQAFLVSPEARDKLSSDGWKVSPTMVGRLLRLRGYSLQSVRKSRESASHPDRNAQFENINEHAKRFMAKNQPVISVDTKKKELVGDFRNSGREWHPKGEPDVALVHDFPQDCEHVHCIVK